MGLGLTVSNLLVEQIGGRMFLDWTSPGVGSRFQIYIPINNRLLLSDREVICESKIISNASSFLYENYQSVISENFSNLDLDEPLPINLKSEYMEMMYTPSYKPNIRTSRSNE